MKYLVTGWTILNDMNYADGRKAEKFLGGVVYAAAGIKPFCDDLLVISAAGPDFGDTFGQYYLRNGLSTRGIQYVLPRTHYNILDYAADGRWWEYSKYGKEFEREWGPKTTIRVEDVVRFSSDGTYGMYFESSIREPIWKDLDRVREAAPNARIMWEIPTFDIDQPEVQTDVRGLINKVDIYSINLPESMTFFETKSEQESVEAILALGKPCFFRVGEKGAHMIVEGNAWFAPSYEPEKSVDPTGCGNCSTAAALYGYCENLHPLKTVILANLAASLNARQYGPYPHFTEELRASLFERAEIEFVRLKKD